MEMRLRLHQGRSPERIDNVLRSLVKVRSDPDLPLKPAKSGKPAVWVVLRGRRVYSAAENRRVEGSAQADATVSSRRSP